MVGGVGVAVARAIVAAAAAVVVGVAADVVVAGGGGFVVFTPRLVGSRRRFSMRTV